MQLNVRDAAHILKVRENTIHRWIWEENLPAQAIEGQYYFDRAELFEWTTAHHINLSVDLFDEHARDQSLPLDLAKALEAGGIVYGLKGSDKASVMRGVVENFSLPEQINRKLLLDLFLAREQRGSTSIGDGIAIPHPRHPLILPVREPVLNLCFLAEPIDFGAKHHEKVRILISLVCPTVHCHLQMLARVARLLGEGAFRTLLMRPASREEILDEVRRVEASFRRETPATRKEFS